MILEGNTEISLEQDENTETLMALRVGMFFRQGMNVNVAALRGEFASVLDRLPRYLQCLGTTEMIF